MAHAEKCPICEGSGRLPLPVEMGTTASRPYDKLCHGCDGKGWVEVQDEDLFPEAHEERFMPPDLHDYYKRMGWESYGTGDFPNGYPALKVPETTG